MLLGVGAGKVVGSWICLECRVDNLADRLDGMWGVRERKAFRMIPEFLLDG